MSVSITEKLLNLTKQLYPTGRAFRLPIDGIMESFHKALIVSETKAYNDALSILYDILPDNVNFSLDDAADWEYRLGLITNLSVSLDDRMAAIKRKMNHPGNIKARQHALYIQGQLQLAGFNVYVYENIPATNPIDALPNVGFGQQGQGQQGDFQQGDKYIFYSYLISAVQQGQGQQGNFQQGGEYNNKVVNNIEKAKDFPFNVGANYRSSFFIMGPTFGTFADIPAAREKEFRQLILKLKPLQTVAYLFINLI